MIALPRKLGLRPPLLLLLQHALTLTGELPLPSNKERVRWRGDICFRRHWEEIQKAHTVKNRTVTEKYLKAAPVCMELIHYDKMRNTSLKEAESIGVKWKSHTSQLADLAVILRCYARLWNPAPWCFMMLLELNVVALLEALQLVNVGNAVGSTLLLDIM